MTTTKQLNAVLGIMLLILGLALTGGNAQAKDTKNNKQNHPDNQAPSITLSAPTSGSASLYPAAFNLTASVSFPGKADEHNDSRGKREGMEIEFLANGIKFAEVERAPYQANYTPPKAGNYTLTARIHYGEGKRTILSNAVNLVSATLPTVSLTAPAPNTITTAPASFTLSANAGSSTGTIAKVEFYANSAGSNTLIGTATAAPYSFVWSNVPFGTYTITARATDNYGFSSTSGSVSVISNAPPVVSLSSPAMNAVSVAPGSFTLTANATDPDGTIAKVEFYNGATLIGSASTAPYSFTWSNVAAGRHSITAKASDNYGASTTSTAISVISDALPVVNLTSPTTNTISTAPGNFTLTTTATSSTSSIAKVDYYANNGTANTLIGTTTAAPYSFIWSNVPAGTYSITAKATDVLGTANTSTPVSLISNAPPTVNLIAPASNSSYTTPANITLTANASDTDGTISKVEFFNGTTLIGAATTATGGAYSVIWNTVPTGNYTITAIATDNRGAQTTSAASAISVIAPPVVTLTAPANNTVATAPGSFTLTATASSAGSITKVDFYASNTATNTLSNIGSVTTGTGGSYSFTWNNVPAGNYNLIAVATDANGAISTSVAVAVISNQAPTVSLTSPTANAVSVAPGSFTLTANAADADGSIAKVEFFNGTTLIGTATTAPYSFAWTNVAAGSYSITAKATDNLGASTTSGAISVISDAVPTISLTSPIANTVSVAPGSFTLTATAASLTSTIAKVDFYASSTSATGTTTNTLIGTATTATGGSGTYNLTWNNVPAGSYSLTAVATDVLGTTATSAAVNIISDAPPTITLTSPASGAKITSPNSFILMASASSTTSTIARVDFYNGTTLIGTATAAPYLFTWSNVPVGSYSLTAKATDALGTATTSAAINVTAIANVPPTVSLTSPANGATVKVPGSFTLTATATSTTSNIAKVEFYASSISVTGTTTNTLVGTATIATGGSYTATWSNVVLGTYSITAKATDTLNATTTSAAINVTVNTGVAQVYYIHADHLDSPRQITDTSGNVVWDWQNTDPFGNNVPNENPSGQGAFNFNMRFSGQYFDKETGLHQNHFRDYDPANGGRYIESDPIGLAGGVNTYAYVRGNPLSRSDPLGLFDFSKLAEKLAVTIIGNTMIGYKALGWGALFNPTVLGCDDLSMTCSGDDMPEIPPPAKSQLIIPSPSDLWPPSTSPVNAQPYTCY